MTAYYNPQADRIFMSPRALTTARRRALMEYAGLLLHECAADPTRGRATMEEDMRAVGLALDEAARRTGDELPGRVLLP